MVNYKGYLNVVLLDHSPSTECNRRDFELHSMSVFTNFIGCRLNRTCFSCS